jgi:hypothetical protein
MGGPQRSLEVGRLEDRLRRLERRLVWQPSAEEYLDASNRVGVRALHGLTELLVPYGFDGGYLFTDHSLRMLSEDTLEQREKDGETVEAWHRAQGLDRVAEVEGAKERLLARLGSRGGT